MSGAMWSLVASDLAAIEEHASPQVIESLLQSARADLARMEREVAWFEGLSARRAGQVARGEWPARAPGGES